MSLPSDGSSATAAVEARTRAIGLALAARMRAYRPMPVELVGDQLMVMLASAPHFRPHLLRFVDAIAGLYDDPGGRYTQRLLGEYLGGDFPDLPVALRPLLRLATARCWPPSLVSLLARAAVASVASRFIASGGHRGALNALHHLQTRGRLASFDVLGESVTSESEADRYRDRYLALVDLLGQATDAGQRTPAGTFKLQISLKLSSLTSDFNPVDPAGTLGRVGPRLEAIAAAARRRGVGMTLDMEHYDDRELALSIFFAAFGPSGRFSDWEGIGVVLQAYLCDAHEVAAGLLRFASRRGAPFQIRLVKGAYWDYETVIAQENGWPLPVWQQKWETDRAFERLSEDLIAAFPRANVAIASHNLRSHAHAEAVREARGLPRGVVEHQTLFRTAEGISRALAGMGWPARDYVPLGELLPGMAYLVRRILENSSQTGFLLHSRSGDSAERLLQAPSEPAAGSGAATPGERS